MIELAWDGFIEHTKQGFNVGKPPYGYLADKIPHPVPARRAEGRTKHRLIPDSVRGPVVTTIFQRRAVHRLSYDDIADLLNDDLDHNPPPQPVDPSRAVGRWTGSAVREILCNPKYTGYMVWNRRRNPREGRRAGKVNPPNEWTWSPIPVHEPLTTRELFDAASPVGRLALLVALRHLAIRGASRQELIPARWLLVASCLTTLALNVAEPMINAEYGRAAFDCVGPLLLIGWSHVGPDLLSAIHRTLEDRRTRSAPEEQDAGYSSPSTLPAVDRNPVPAAEVVARTAVPPDGDPIWVQLLAAATKVNAAHWLERGRPASAETLRKRLHIGSATARRLRASLRLVGPLSGRSGAPQFVVQRRLVGHGPTLFAGLSKRVDLRLVSRLEFGSGAVAMRYEPRR